MCENVQRKTTDPEVGLGIQPSEPGRRRLPDRKDRHPTGQAAPRCTFLGRALGPTRGSGTRPCGRGPHAQARCPAEDWHPLPPGCWPSPGSHTMYAPGNRAALCGPVPPPQGPCPACRSCTGCRASLQRKLALCQTKQSCRRMSHFASMNLAGKMKVNQACRATLDPTARSCLPGRFGRTHLQ